MRGLSRWIMIRLAEAIMIASVAALARHFVPKRALPRFTPGASRGTDAGGRNGGGGGSPLTDAEHPSRS